MILRQNHIAEGNKSTNPFGNPENVNVFGLTSPFGRGVAEGDGEGTPLYPNPLSHGFAVPALPEGEPRGNGKQAFIAMSTVGYFVFPLDLLVFSNYNSSIPSF